MSNQPVINAQARQASTKGAVNALRRNGKIPAVMYDRHGAAASIAIDGDEFRKVTKGVSESTIIKLLVDGKENECFIKDRQIDWLHSQILHIDFFKVERGVALRVKVPVHISGTAVGVREGGILETPTHELEVECLPKDVPERIDIDVSELHANHSIHVRDIKLAEGVKVITSPDQVVVLVKYAKGEAPAAEAAAEPAAQ